MQVAGEVVAILAGGHPDVGRGSQLEFGREDSDERVTSTVEHQRVADDARVGAKVALPQAVADQNDRGVAALVFFGSEGAAWYRTDSKQRKKARGCDARLEPFWLAFFGQIKSPRDVDVRGHPGKTFCLASKIEKIA